MTLPYGFVRATLTSVPRMKASKHSRETQYHLHVGLDVDGGEWDVAINVGTNDDDDLLKYKLAYDYDHPMLATLALSKAGAHDLTGTQSIPALDLLRGDVLEGTGKWRDSDVMDGSEFPEPAASLKRLLVRAHDEGLTVFVFGRFYKEGDGIHDTHLNQGSTKSFVHRAGDDDNDQNDIWQDGALLVMLGADGWAAYFAAFTQQLVPTDGLGNPTPGAKPIDNR